MTEFDKAGAEISPALASRWSRATLAYASSGMTSLASRSNCAASSSRWIQQNELSVLDRAETSSAGLRSVEHRDGGEIRQSERCVELLQASETHGDFESTGRAQLVRAWRVHWEVRAATDTAQPRSSCSCRPRCTRGLDRPDVGH